MDGTTTDFVRGLIDLWGRTHDVPYESITTLDISKHLGRTPEEQTEAEMWRRIHAVGEDFWADLPILPEAHAILNWARERADNVRILTHPSKCISSRIGKLRWLKKHGFDDCDEAFATKGKHFYGQEGHLLIDDFTHNVEGFVREGGSAILIRQPWTRATAMDIPCVDSSVFNIRASTPAAVKR